MGSLLVPLIIAVGFVVLLYQLEKRGKGRSDGRNRVSSSDAGYHDLNQFGDSNNWGGQHHHHHHHHGCDSGFFGHHAGDSWGGGGDCGGGGDGGGGCS